MSSPPVPPPPPDVDGRLRRAYQVLSAHLDNTPLAVIEWDRGTHVARWSGQAERLFGWAAAEVVGKRATDWRFVHEDDLARVRDHVHEVTAGRAKRSVIRNRNYTKAGGVVWCEWHNSLLLDEAGGVSSVLSLVLDVTARQTAAESLARGAARLRAALDSAQMLTWDWDLTTGRSYYSADHAAFYGLPPDPDSGQGEAGWVTVHPDDVPAVRGHLERAVATCGDLDFEYRGRVPRTDGETRWFTTRGQVLGGPDGKAERVVAVTTDVTDRKRDERDRAALDRQLLDAQKWESLGVLAGGVAHDFNNILTVVMGGAGLARRLIPADSPAAPLLDQVDAAARRAADLCRQMLLYAGRGPTSPGRADLNRLIRDAAPLLEVPVGRHAKVRYDLAPALPPTPADAAQLRQVLVSLVMNAAEALPPGGGEVVVRTWATAVDDPDPEAFRLVPPPGRFVVLEVADTGTGMTDEVKGRMFDPFFTTKFPGRGLGLSAVFGVVRGHGGGIAVETAAGKGTTVRVYWPADPAAPVEVAAPPHPGRPAVAAVAAPAPPVPRAAGLALVVDDEVYVRELVASTLEDLGYEAVVAADGATAVALFDRHRPAVTLAVIDVVMPGMTGEQVLAAVREREPGLPVVVVSGYADRRLGGDRVAFVQKPFRPEELVAAVTRVTG